MVEAGANQISEAEILDALDIAHDAIKKLCAAQRELAEKVGKEKLSSRRRRSTSSCSPRSAPRTARSSTRPPRSSTSSPARTPPRPSRPPCSSSTRARRTPTPTPSTARRRSSRSTASRRRPSASGSPSTRSARTAARRRRSARSPSRPGLLPRTHGSALFTPRPDAGPLGRRARHAQGGDAARQPSGSRRRSTTGTTTTSRPSAWGRPASCAARSGVTSVTARWPSGPSSRSSRRSRTSRTRSAWSRTSSSPNGSSSMASVCGSSLSLMDAGVPIKAPVAGIAMGLIKEGDDYTVLTDIAGVEDHLGDMDFKVAGTEQGITALQMDIKITGVTFDILRDALSQARDARLDILGQMAAVIDGPRTELSKYAPRIIQVQIDPSKIGMLIGKGGETIRGLSEEFESQIDVNDEGQVLIYSANGELGEKLRDRIESMLKDVEVGDEFPAAKVVKTTTFGAFVELSKGTDGLLHISNVKPGERVDTVEDVLNKGDEISVRVVEVDRERGRIGLRLAEDPEIAGKSVEELAGVGSGRRRWRRRPRPPARNGGDRGPRREGGGGDRGPRGSGRPRHGSGRDRDRDYIAAGPPTDGAGLRRPGRHGAHGLRAIRGAGFWIGAGSVGETETEAGLSHLVEHMLFRGTARYGSLEIDQLFDTMGAELNAGTGKETTSVYTRVIDEHLPDAFDVMADMVWRPRFAADDLDNERQIVLEEIAMYEDDPQDKVFDVLGEAVFGHHPLVARSSAVRRSSRACRPTACSRSTTPATCRATSWWRPRATSTTTPSSRWSRPPAPSAPARPRRRPARRRSRRPPGACSSPSRPSRSTSVSAPRDRPRRRAPLRAARPRQHLRRHVLVAPVPGGARAAGPRLRGVLVLVAAPGHGPGRPVPRHAPGQTSGRRCRWWAASSSACAASRRRPRSSPAARRTSRPHGPGPRVDVGADEPPRVGGAGRPAAAVARRGRRAHRGGDARGRRGARRRAVRTRAPERRGHRRRRGAFRPRSSRSRPRWRRPRERRAAHRRGGRRRTDGRGGLRRRGRRGRPGPRGTRRPAARRRRRGGRRRRRRPRGLHHPGRSGSRDPRRAGRGHARRRRLQRLGPRRGRGTRTPHPPATSSSRRTSPSARC